MAGDIGCVFDQSYTNFLTRMSNLFEYVFIITGNHEYYHVRGRKLKDVDQWFDYIESHVRTITSKLKNVIYLQNELFVIPETNICLYGSTLWSNIADHERGMVRQRLSDYQRIPRMSIRKSCELFEKNVRQLAEMLEQNADKQIIIVTHHLPSYQLICQKYRDCEINSAFASEVDLINNPHIVAWVAGHTHHPVEKNKFHVNPVGYPGENNNNNFNKTFSITSDDVKDMIQ